MPQKRNRESIAVPKKETTIGISFLEKYITNVSLVVLLLGTIISIILPVVLSSLASKSNGLLWGISGTHELGDALGGISSPIIGVVGVFLTFLAFYIQYMANERQVQELEKQKRNIEYKDTLERINDLKTDIKDLTYTHEGIKYNYSEAIWHFMHQAMEQNILENKNQDSVISPMFYQLAYVLTLFEPMMSEIERTNLDEKDKKAAYIQLDGIFESSLDLILQISSNNGLTKKRRLIKHSLKTKIIIPAKKVKLLLRKKVSKYSDSEKEQFQNIAIGIKGSVFIRQARALQNKGVINYFTSYDEYLQSVKGKSDEKASRNSYNNLIRHNAILKMLITESVKVMMSMDSLESLEINIQSERRAYRASIDRSELEDFLQLDLAELKIDKEMWRDEFLGRFVYDSEGNDAFLELFVSIKELQSTNEQTQDSPDKPNDTTS